MRRLARTLKVQGKMEGKKRPHSKVKNSLVKKEKNCKVSFPIVLKSYARVQMLPKMNTRFKFEKYFAYTVVRRVTMLVLVRSTPFKLRKR